MGIDHEILGRWIGIHAIRSVELGRNEWPRAPIPISTSILGFRFFLSRPGKGYSNGGLPSDWLLPIPQQVNFSKLEKSRTSQGRELMDEGLCLMSSCQVAWDWPRGTNEDRRTLALIPLLSWDLRCERDLIKTPLVYDFNQSSYVRCCVCDARGWGCIRKLSEWCWLGRRGC